MQNRLMIGAAFVATLLAAPAYAAGSHAGGHDDEMALGKAGEASQVTRTVEVSMVETDDGRMVFEPKTIDVKEGETVRFTFQNKGELPHEFVMDTSGSIQEHKEVMERFPEMEHADPNSISLQPGETGETEPEGETVMRPMSSAQAAAILCGVPGSIEAVLNK